MRMVGRFLLPAVWIALLFSACTGAPDAGTDGLPGSFHETNASKRPGAIGPKAGEVADGEDGGDAGAGRVEFRLVASQKTVPRDFDRHAWKRQQVPKYEYLVRRVDQAAPYEAAWKWFRLEGKRPAADFARETVWFIALHHESGSCPLTLADARVDAANRALRVSVAAKTPGQDNERPIGTGLMACTADATPRTFVFTVAKDAVQGVERVVIVEGERETEIPLDALVARMLPRSVDADLPRLRDHRSFPLA